MRRSDQILPRNKMETKQSLGNWEGGNMNSLDRLD